MMWDSLLKMRALPDDFKLYCGHEYTAANVKFALTVEPNNAALKPTPAEVTRMRAAHKPTIPTLLGEEKKANVFLRADEPSVAASVRMKGRRAAEGFGELRERQNKSCWATADGSAALRHRDHRAAAIAAAPGRRPLSRDLSRPAKRYRRTRAVDRDLFPAGAWRALALASHPCGGELA